MKIKIEKNIPIPNICIKSGMAEALRSCEVGDSFVIPDSPSKGTNASIAAARLGMKVATRKQPDGSFRIWRIA